MPETSKRNNSGLTEGRYRNGTDDTNDTALFVSGSPAGVSPDILHELADQTGFTLAVDAGAEQLITAGIIPDLLIGDFDSISKDTLQRLEKEGVPVEKFSAYKNATDVELGVEALRARGYKRLIATNVLGGRTDHALGSLGALAGAVHDHGMQVALRDEHEACYFLRGTTEDADENVLELDFEKSMVSGCPSFPLLPPPHPRHVSLMAWGGSVEVSIHGTEWPLDHHMLSPYSALGISNVLCASVLKLEVHKSKGVVLLLLSY